MHEIVVRAETRDDLRAIDVVNLSAFQGEEEARLISALRASKDFNPELSLVAELNGRIVGHLLLSPVRMRRNGQILNVLALGPMSVVPSQSHRGIGSALMEAAISRARELGYGAIVVAGRPDYYQRLGFSPASRWALYCNIDVPDEALTAMELEPGLLTKGGEVQYPAPFAELF
ncbi:MAG: N-acetyltransferase [Gammaproteobacteria bacterium]